MRGAVRCWPQAEHQAALQRSAGARRVLAQPQVRCGCLKLEGCTLTKQAQPRPRTSPARLGAVSTTSAQPLRAGARSRLAMGPDSQGAAPMTPARFRPARLVLGGRACVERTKKVMGQEAQLWVGAKHACLQAARTTSLRPPLPGLRLKCGHVKLVRGASTEQAQVRPSTRRALPRSAPTTTAEVLAMRPLQMQLWVLAVARPTCTGKASTELAAHQLGAERAVLEAVATTHAGGPLARPPRTGLWALAAVKSTYTNPA